MRFACVNDGSCCNNFLAQLGDSPSQSLFQGPCVLWAINGVKLALKLTEACLHEVGILWTSKFGMDLLPYGRGSLEVLFIIIWERIKGNLGISNTGFK